jgi:hypothetical protein
MSSPRKSVNEILTPTPRGNVSPPYPNPPLKMSLWLQLPEIVEWVGMSDSVDELNEFIQKTAQFPESTAHQAAIVKRAQLQFEARMVPHWTQVPNFWLTAVAAIAAIAAGVIAWFAWRYPISPSTPSDQKSPTNSSPSLPSAQSQQTPK